MDTLCRVLHLHNASLEPAGDTLLFLNFDAGVFPDNRTALNRLSALKEWRQRKPLLSKQIVCELTERQNSNASALAFVCGTMRESGFRITVDDFGSQSSDIHRVELINLDIVKLDAKWSIRLMQSQSGFQTPKDTV